MADNTLAHHYVTDHPVFRQPAELDVGPCPQCGSTSPAEPSQPTRVMVLRATLPQSIAAAMLQAQVLSSREWVAFELLGLGFDNRSIAREMNISERTAKRHVTAILKKLQLESRLQAGLAALIVSSCSAAGAGLAQKSHGRGASEGAH
jgi:DNA-binding CsgD family transcriptional regulator